MTELDFDRFAAGAWPAEDFGHHRHIEAAYMALSRYTFLRACVAVSGGIRTMAIAAGALEKYNETITVAAMSLIAERMTEGCMPNFDDFVASNPDLLDRGILDSRYSNVRVRSPLARKQFLLPDLAP